jgi:hypothetical protein
MMAGCSFFAFGLFPECQKSHPKFWGQMFLMVLTNVLTLLGSSSFEAPSDLVGQAMTEK